MLWSKRRIYLDYASALPVLPRALRAMKKAERYQGNPGAIHREGVEAKRALDGAREKIAALVGCKSREIIFTSGLTESNNLAIIGYARQLERVRRDIAGTHWVVSAIEHSSILDCFAEIERVGGKVSHVTPDARGIITPGAVAKALRPETVFVSVGWANNEIGTVQPLADIARGIRAHEKKYGHPVAFHSDAGQAPLYRATAVHSLGVDLLSLGSNKLYGPHGVGALFVSTRVDLVRIVEGGGQERGLRPGTENVALAAGFAEAFAEIARMRPVESKRVAELRDVLLAEIQKAVPDVVVNGTLSHALPHMLNISIPNISSEYLTLALDNAGIAVSTKSACREGEESRSHVVEALSGEAWRAQNTLRFSLGMQTRSADVRRAATVLSELVVRSAKK